jgi:hypothetical protein
VGAALHCARARTHGGEARCNASKAKRVTQAPQRRGACSTLYAPRMSRGSVKPLAATTGLAAPAGARGPGGAAAAAARAHCYAWTQACTRVGRQAWPRLPTGTLHPPHRPLAQHFAPLRPRALGGARLRPLLQRLLHPRVPAARNRVGHAALRAAGGVSARAGASQRAAARRAAGGAVHSRSVGQEHAHTHPLARALITLRPHRQLLRGAARVSALRPARAVRCRWRAAAARGARGSRRRERAGCERRAAALRASVTRMTNTCATQRCDLLVNGKLPSSWRARARRVSAGQRESEP